MQLRIRVIKHVRRLHGEAVRREVRLERGNERR